jgi:hypothetical protein
MVMIARRAFVTLALAAALWVDLVPTLAHEDGHDGTAPFAQEHAGISDYTYTPATWNSWYVYLSPAHHWTGYKYGCSGYVEDLNLPLVAGEAASGAGTDLKDRGYRVRVGRADPDENVSRSNGWGTDSMKRHISIHSNASSNPACPPGAGRGTRTFYYSATGHDLADDLWDTIKAASPGADGTRANSVKSSSLYELKETDAVAAYVEAEFHDWPGGVTWLEDYDTWSWRIGWAVDVHLGYP